MVNEPACTCRCVKSAPEHAPDCAVTLARAPKSVPGWERNLRPKRIGPWTVIIDREKKQIMEVYGSNEPTCGGGPDACGGCRVCFGTPDPEHFDMRHDLDAEALTALLAAFPGAEPGTP